MSTRRVLQKPSHPRGRPLPTKRVGCTGRNQISRRTLHRHSMTWSPGDTEAPLVPSSGCKTSSTATRVAGSQRTPGSQQRLQDIIYRHSGCREPAVIYRRPMLPGFGIHLDVGDSGVQFGAGQMSAAGLHAALKVQVRAARHRAGLASERVCNVR